MSDPFAALAGLTAPVMVYDLLLHSQASVTVGHGRRWEWTDTPPKVVTGYIASPSPREQERAARMQVTVDAVARLPHGTPIDETDDLEAPAGGSPPIPGPLVGRYSVTAVRWNPADLRVTLSRVAGEAEPAHG